MRITKVTNNQRIQYYKPAKQTSFGGLTQTFEKAVYALPYKRAEEIVDLYEKPNLFVGHFPKDILEILKKTVQAGSELKPKIQTFNKKLA